MCSAYLDANKWGTTSKPFVVSLGPKLEGGGMKWFSSNHFHQEGDKDDPLYFERIFVKSFLTLSFPGSNSGPSVLDYRVHRILRRGNTLSFV